MLNLEGNMFLSNVANKSQRLEMSQRFVSGELFEKYQIDYLDAWR